MNIRIYFMYANTIFLKDYQTEDKKSVEIGANDE